MDGTSMKRSGIAAKVAATAALIALGEWLVDGGSSLGSVIGGFALAWLALLPLVRPAVARSRPARIAALAAAGFAGVLVVDPGHLAWLLFWTALSLAALLPRRGFDDALSWGQRLTWYIFAGLAAPTRDVARISSARRERGIGLRAAPATLILPLVGGAVFVALFAAANPPDR